MILIQRLMKLFTFAFRRETAVPLLAVTFASIVSVLLDLARIAWTGNVRDYGFLIWNLFLAWIPLVFALQACRQFCRCSKLGWDFAAWTGAWLVFFPNAPYILTDIIHLTQRYRGQFWVDLVLILSCALTGLVLGFISLFLMQGVVARLWGRVASWLFVALVAGLSSIGIYLGRFLRFNSWDVLMRPVKLSKGIFTWATDPVSHSTNYAFPMLFAVFLFVGYLMLYALTHLSPVEMITEERA